jgi:hypothetical protein
MHRAVQGNLRAMYSAHNANPSKTYGHWVHLPSYLQMTGLNLPWDPAITLAKIQLARHHDCRWVG